MKKCNNCGDFISDDFEICYDCSKNSTIEKNNNSSQPVKEESKSSSFFSKLTYALIIIVIWVFYYNYKSESRDKNFELRQQAKKEISSKENEEYREKRNSLMARRAAIEAGLFEELNSQGIKVYGLKIDDLKSSDGKLYLSKGDGASSGEINYSEEQLIFYAYKLSGYLYKKEVANDVLVYLKENHIVDVVIWDVDKYHSAWILKNNAGLWKFIDDL
jgi:hypothetical protein